MGRIVAIDYGTKRTGLAVSDIMQLIAGGLCTVPSDKAAEFLNDYAAKEDVDLFIIGMPRQMNNEPSNNMRHVETFVKRLNKLVPNVPIKYIDERFTSVLAQKAMIDGGLKKQKRRDKALVDEISAVIILQDYLENIRINK